MRGWHPFVLFYGGINKRDGAGIGGGRNLQMREIQFGQVNGRRRTRRMNHSVDRCYWSDPPMSGQLVKPMPEHFRGQTAYASIRFNGSPVKVVI